MGVCQQCIHFRRLKPASQLLAQILTTTDAAVSNALIKVQEDESQQQGFEAQLRMRKETANDETWGFRPGMSDFCGLRETEEVFLIAEIKNFGGRCKDFATGPPAERSCLTCRHRVVATGLAKDLKVAGTYEGMAETSRTVSLGTDLPDDLLKKHREGIGSRKAFELAAVYAAKGVLAVKPEYFDHCSRFSKPGEFVICALRNPHQTCASWEPLGQSPEPARQVAAPVPGEAATKPVEMVTASSGKVTVPPLRMEPPSNVSPGTSVFTQIRTASPDQTQNQVLVSGPVELRLSTVNEFFEYLEWILEVQLTDEARRIVHESLVDTWKEDDPSGIQFVERSLATVQQVRKVDQATQDFYREYNQQNIVAMLRSTPHPMSVVLLRLYDAANAPLAPGNPPLTRESAECYMDMMTFMHAEAMNVAPRSLPQEIRERWFRQLISEYPRLPDDTRAFIGDTPLKWRQLKASWPQIPDPEKELIRRSGQGGSD